MPLRDSKTTTRTGLESREAGLQGSGHEEEITTPIEAEIQQRAESDFNKPPKHKKAIVSVNGEDVEEMPLTHDRAA